MTRGTIITKEVEAEGEKPNHRLPERDKISFPQEAQELHHQGDHQDHGHGLHQDMIGHIAVIRLKCGLVAQGLGAGAIAIANQGWQVRL